MEKLCYECGDPIQGRSDKKFCCDMCRNSHNNRLNSDCNNLVRNVNNVLRKNRRLLEEFLTDKAGKVSKVKIAEKGFNFLFYTSSLTTKKEVTYFFCYDFGYFTIDREHIFIVKKKDYAMLPPEKLVEIA